VVLKEPQVLKELKVEEELQGLKVEPKELKEQQVTQVPKVLKELKVVLKEPQVLKGLSDLKELKVLQEQHLQGVLDLRELLVQHKVLREPRARQVLKELKELLLALHHLERLVQRELKVPQEEWDSKVRLVKLVQQVHKELKVLLQIRDIKQIYHQYPIQG
jgi:hypothetical protein